MGARRPVALLAVVVAVASIVGIVLLVTDPGGGGGVAAPTDVSTTRGFLSESTVPPTRDAPASLPDDLDVCSLLTTEEVRSAIGATPEPVASTEGAFERCDWRSGSRTFALALDGVTEEERLRSVATSQARLGAFLQELASPPGAFGGCDPEEQEQCRWSAYTHGIHVLLVAGPVPATPGLPAELASSLLTTVVSRVEALR